MAELLAANQITIAKVLDGEKGEMSAEQIAQLNQASEDASQAKSDVANLEIGGRNLLIGSEKGVVNTNADTSSYADIKLQVYNGKTYVGLEFRFGVTAGEHIEYTYTSQYSGDRVIVGDNGGAYDGVETFLVSEYKEGVVYTLSCDVIDDRPNVVGGYVLKNIKLEKGNKATDWTPAPEDVDAGIANAAKVATNFLGYDSTNGLIIGNKTSGTWSGYRSQILPGSFNVLDASSTVLASFGPTTIIGEEANANLHLTFNNLSMVDKDGTKFFEVGDNRNAEGIATVKYKDTGYVYPDTGSAVVVVYSRILSIVSVYVDSVELSSSEYSFSGQKVTINNLTPNTIINVEITYTTLNPYFYLTFGKRLPSSEIGMYSVAEGRDVTASGYASHAEGMDTIASEQYSHAEGCNTTASSARAHAEGYNTTASGNESHAEGYNTTASSGGAHAEGRGTTASHSGAHAEGGGTTASGLYSHSGGYYTKADGNYMTAIGKYNTKNSGKAFAIGNGTSDMARSDAFTVDWSGNTVMKGGLALGTALSIANGGTDATSLAGAQENLGIKAISERIDNLILGTGTSPVEVQDARLSGDGTRYPTLKSRLDAENSELKSDLTSETNARVNADNALSARITNKVAQPLDGNNQPTNGTSGQSLRTKGDGTTEWASVGLPTYAQTADAVSAWLDEHPEATTTVQDGAVTAAKLAVGSVTEAKFSDALKLKTIKDYVTPEMFGAVGDGMTDDTSAFNSAIASGKKVLVPEGNYYLSSHIFSDENIVEDNGTYVNKPLIVSKVICGGSVSALNMPMKDLTSLGLKGVQGVTFNPSTNHIILSSHKNLSNIPTIVEVDLDSWGVINSVSDSALGHINDLTYNQNTNKYYCTPMNEVGVILSIDANLMIDETIIIDGITEIPRRISYDEDNNIYYIGTNGGLFVVDENFNLIKTINTNYDKLDDCDYQNIASMATQGSTVYNGQFISLMWFRGADDSYPSICRLGTYNYVTGKTNKIYDIFTSGTFDEPEAIVIINNELFVFGYVGEKLTQIKVYPDINSISVPNGVIKLDLTASSLPDGMSVTKAELSGMYPDWFLHLNITTANKIEAGSSFGFKLNPDMRLKGIGLGWSGSSLIAVKLNGNNVNCRPLADAFNAGWSADIYVLAHSLPLG